MTRARVAPGFDRAAWERLEVASPLHRADWLEAMSSRLPGALHTVTSGAHLGFLAAVVSDPEAYEAYNPYAILWRDPPVFELADPARRRQALERLRAQPAELLPALVLVVPGYLGDPAGPAGTDPAAVHACLGDLVDWCRERGLAGLYVLYTGDAGSTVRKAVEAMGGSSFALTSRWRLPVWWDTWDGYLAGLPSRRRLEVTRQLRRAAEAGVITGRIDPERHFDHILASRTSLLRHHGQPHDEAAERWRLRRLIDLFGPALTAYGAFLGDEPVAATVCVRHGRSMHVVYAGTTEEGYRVPYAHFLATYYAVAQHIGRSELDEVDYGIGHGMGKELRGCRPAMAEGHGIGVDERRRRLLNEAARLLTQGGGA